MPHATLPSTGFQAVILCGPGESLNPFNSNPKDFPKALIPIANRPMLWYPLDWCYRMGVTNIHLITPQESLAAIDAALSQNPYLTTLPSPRPNVLAPADVTLTTGTAELFLAPEVREAIIGDFVVLPCDLVCELNGLSLLETWFTTQAALGGTAHRKHDTTAASMQSRGGGLCVHYNTKNHPEGPGVGVKNEETDFIATTDPAFPSTPPSPHGSLIPNVQNLALTMPTATLEDVIEEKKSLQVRYALLKKHGRVRTLMTHRDAHIYIFPYWVLDLIAKNETFENVSEDLLGWWAKAGWQDALAEKLGLGSIFGRERRSSKAAGQNPQLKDPNVADLSSTWTSVTGANDDESGAQPARTNEPVFASRVTNPPPFDSSSAAQKSSTKSIRVPPLLTYIHPSGPNTPLIRRVDTAPLLLSISLHLAKLPPQEESSSTPNPLSHTHKVHPTTTTPQRCTVTRGDTLIDANVTVAEKTAIKESVVGAGCVIHSGARLTRCLLMEGAVVDEGAILAGCVVGRRARIGKGAELKDCFVQEGFAVPESAVGKGETFAGFEEGLDDLDEEFGNGDAPDEHDDDDDDDDDEGGIGIGA